MSRRKYEVILENKAHGIEYIVNVYAENVDDAFDRALSRFELFEGDEIEMKLKSCTMLDLPFEKDDMDAFKRQRDLELENE